MEEKLNKILVRLESIEEKLIFLNENVNGNASIAGRNFQKLDDKLSEKIENVKEEILKIIKEN